MWLDPMGKFVSLVGLQGLFILNFFVINGGFGLIISYLLRDETTTKIISS
jgi:hypothetical protein